MAANQERDIDFREWSCEEVAMWLREKHFDEEIVKKFSDQKIKGRHLLSLKKSDSDMLIKCGLETVGDQMEFFHHVESLIKEDTSDTSSAACELPKGAKKKEKLTAPEIKQLDAATKVVYLNVLSKIRSATVSAFPGDVIPSIRDDRQAAEKVDSLVENLTSECSIQKINFGREGIREHVKAVLYERRRMISLGHSYEKKGKKTRTSSSTSPSSSSGSDPGPLLSDDSSEPESDAAFSFPLRVAEIIACKVFDKLHAGHIQLHRHILPACRLLKVAGIRGKTKCICLKKLAEALIAHDYVVLGCDIKTVTSNDVSLVSGKDLCAEVLNWQELQKNKENRPKN